MAVTRGRAAAGDGGGSGDPPVRGRQGTLRRRFTFDDALAAAEALREISAGHEEAAMAVLNAAALDGLSNEELSELCDRFGVEV